MSSERRPGRLADVLDDDVGAAAAGRLPHAAFTSPEAWFTVASAPSSRARASFSSLEDVTIACAPSAVASASAAVETPLPIPQIRTHSPACRWARVTSIR